MGIFSSSLSENQIFAFILGAALCFLVFYGPEAAASLTSNGTTQQLIKKIGAKVHFEDIAKGVLDTRDLFYFLSVTAFFVFLAVLRLKNQKTLNS